MHALQIIEQNEVDTKRLLIASIVDWLRIAEQMQRLSWDILEDASSLVRDPSDVPDAHLVAHYVVARLNDEMRAVTSLVSSGFVIQALSLDAGMLEFAFTVGWIGKRQDHAQKWLEWKKETTIPHSNVTAAIEATYRNGERELTSENVRAEKWHYTRLCQLKHGNPVERRQFGIDMDEVGRPVSVGDALPLPFIDGCRLAIWYGLRYLCLATSCYNDFHAASRHHAQRSLQLKEIRELIERTRYADEMRTAARDS